MKRLKPWVAGVGLCAAVAPAAALVVNFETALPAGFSFSDGITLVPDSASGGTLFDQLPYLPDGPPKILDNTDGTVMSFKEFGSGVDYSLNFSSSSGFAGFSAVSFQYSALELTQVRFTDASGGEVTVTEVTRSATLSGADLPTVAKAGTSELYNLAGTDFDDVCGNLVQGKFCNWTNVNFLLDKTATTMHFNYTGSGGTALFDNYDFKMEPTVPVTEVPEPSTYALMAFGLAGVFMMSRRRRQA